MNVSQVQPPELPAMLYGWAFPKVMMTFTIFCTFWVFAPLLSVIALVYFVLIQVQFRYLILYRFAERTSFASCFKEDATARSEDRV